MNRRSQLRTALAGTDAAPPALRPFFVLRETPCPYLPGRRERKLVTELFGPGAAQAYDALARGGFRRSHVFAYRPACRGCSACVPARVDARAYRPGRTLRRIARHNADLRAAEAPARATAEQYRLFARYLRARHGDGEMAGMGFADYRQMVEETQVDTRLVEFRNAGGTLLAGLLFDRMADGASAVYSFFEPALPRRSLGSYVVHWLVTDTARRGRPYVYLGYWVEGSPKMAYKTRFRPLEGLTPEGWRRLFG